VQGWITDAGACLQNGVTPLFMAAQQDYLSVVQLLVQAGAHKDAPDKVRGRRRGDVGRSIVVCVSCRSLQSDS